MSDSHPGGDRRPRSSRGGERPVARVRDRDVPEDVESMSNPLQLQATQEHQAVRPGGRLPAEHATERIGAAVRVIRERFAAAPTVAIILGTGLGGLADQIEASAVIDYGDIPHFPLSTVESHAGRLLCGTLGGKTVVAMQGRFHRYEGYTLQQVTFPVRVLRALGARTLVVSNACGGMNPLWAPGDVMLIADHINLLGDNPLVGPNDDSLGPRFPDMSQPYDAVLRAVARAVALERGIPLREGVYVAVTGPNLESRAEYRMLRALGADVVGMSTVPEVIVAVHGGMRVLGLSIITDQCLPDALEPVSVEKIIGVATRAEPKLTEIVSAVVERL
jgi:purine-nucleoside phosphorylase